MAHLLNAERISVALPDRELLKDVSLGIDDGDRVGVVGRNGDGKSTLLRVLTGQAEPDSGRVSVSRGVTLGYLKQTDELDESATVIESVVGDVAAHEWAADPKVRAVMHGLLSDIEVNVPGGYEAKIGELSGGQRRRVALAGVLTRDVDVLVLDEPTNHLDVEGVAWLAEHLKGRWPAGKGALLLVTHDRWFLDAVCGSTWEVFGAGVTVREGGYAAYVLGRAERDRVEAATFTRAQNLMRKELAWLRRGAPARTSKPKFRIDAANELISKEPPVRDNVELLNTAQARLGKDVIDVEDLTYDLPGPDGRRIFDDVTWRLGPGDRFGIVGVNGAGKSTLLRLMTGDIRPGDGRVKRGRTVKIAVLSQDLRELDEVADLPAQEAVAQVRGEVEADGKEVTASELTKRLGFTKQRAWTRVAELSGGERRRLQLARLLMDEPNVLLLDEPTNDLDTDTLAAMEDVLDGFAGTMIVVSHDRYLLERVTDRVVGILGDGKIRDLPRGVDEYLELRQAVERGSSGGASANAGATPKIDGAAVRAAQKEAGRAERKLAQLTEKYDQIMDELAGAASDHELAARLDAQRAELAQHMDETEAAWLDAMERAEG